MTDDESEAEGIEAVTVAREALIGQLVTFVRALRGRGVEVPADATLTGARALAVVGLADRERVRVGLRAALISRREDLEVFERLFPAFWQRLTDTADGDRPSDRPAEPLVLDGAAEPAGDDGAGEAPDDEAGVPLESRREPAGMDDREGDGEAAETAVYSPTGRPERVEATGGLTGTDAELAGPVRELTAALAGLRGRRWAPDGDTHPDVRRALRRSVETGGAVLDLPGRERRESAVRAVLFVDVSRSVLDTIDRGFLLSFIRTVREAWRDVAVFFFDTSVREVSDAFDAPTPDAALSALEAAEAAWGGGTRIGHAIEAARHEHPLLVDRDTVVLVISDGLEVGEIDRLEGQMAWLSRRAGAVLWANPLAASPGYEPTCRGMAAALPYVDGLFAFSDSRDVAEMARQLGRYGPGDRVGYEYDVRGRP